MSGRFGPLLVAALLALAVGCGRGPRPAEPADESAEGGDAPLEVDEVALDLRDGATAGELAAFAKRHGGLALVRFTSEHEVGTLGAGLAVARLTTAGRDARPTELLRELRKDPLVERAEPNMLLRFPETDLLGLDRGDEDLIPDDGKDKPLDGFPNDPFFPKQWHMTAVGAREAWRFSRGDGVIVAVIDTGVAYTKERGLLAPDLAQTAFVPGWDFVRDEPVAADDHGHGTHCAGTIAQSTHNGRGVAGLAPGARIMPIKVLTSGGWGTLDAVAAGIRYAADHGAKVLSLSLGGGGRSKILDDAVKHARDRGCAVVCAAGNGGRRGVSIPAACPGAIAVSSTGPKGKLAFYSSFGKEVFCAGPGGDKSEGVTGGVLQATLDPRDKQKTCFAWWQGTSMATPHVAATCALLAGAGVSEPDAMKSIIAATARKPEGAAPGWDEKLGWGTVDAAAAVRRARLLPSLLSLSGALVLAGVAAALAKKKVIGRGLLVLGAVAGSSGLFFLRPAGIEFPGVGLLERGVPAWDGVLLGAGQWNPLFASALIPCVLGLMATPRRAPRSFAVGLALGWAAHLGAQAFLGWSCVRFVPESLETFWLAGNAIALLPASAVFVRLGQSREIAP